MTHTHPPFAFVHVPKTGGETINLLLGMSEKDHSPAWQRRELLGKDVWDRIPYRFAVVRNPWDRMVSWYFHLRKHTYLPELHEATCPQGRRGPSYCVLQSGGKMMPEVPRELAQTMPFTEWLRAVLLREGHLDGNLGLGTTQWSMVADPRTGQMHVMHLYLFEDFHGALSDIVKRAKPCGEGVSVNGGMSNSPVVNNSIHEPFETYYDRESAMLVAHVFAKDIREFGYAPPACLRKTHAETSGGPSHAEPPRLRSFLHGRSSRPMAYRPTTTTPLQQQKLDLELRLLRPRVQPPPGPAANHFVGYDPLSPRTIDR